MIPALRMPSMSIFLPLAANFIVAFTETPIRTSIYRPWCFQFSVSHSCHCGWNLKKNFFPNDIKVPCIDEIIPKVLNCVFDIASTVLHHIFTLVFFYRYLLLFQITKGPQKSPWNYRPISLHVCTKNILEQVIEKHLRKFWEGNKILFNFQFGFRKGYDTSHSLLETVNSICSFLDRNEIILVSLWTFKKHLILLIIELCPVHTSYVQYSLEMPLCYVQLLF